MTQAFRSIASEAEASAQRAVRAMQTIARIRVNINTAPTTRALAALEQSAQKSGRSVREALTGTAGRLNVTPALASLRTLAVGAQTARSGVDRSLSGIRPTIVTAPFQRSLQGLGTAAEAVSRALKADLGTFTPKLAAEGLVRPLADLERRADAVGVTFRNLVPDRLPTLPVAPNVTALGRLATAAGRMSAALDRAFIVAVPRLDVRGLEVPLRSASTAAQRAGDIIRTALANLRVTLDASPILTPLRRVEAASRASASVVKAQFSNLRVVIAESPAIAALTRVRQATTSTARDLRERLSGIRLSVDVRGVEQALSALQRRAVLVGRASALALGLIAPKIDLRAIFAPLQQLAERAGAAARRVAQAFAALRPTLNLREAVGTLTNLQQRAQGVARSIRGALSDLRVRIDTSDVARSLSTAVQRSQEGAREVARAFASLRPNVDLSSLARLPALATRIRQSFQSITPTLNLRGLQSSLSSLVTQAQTAARSVGQAMARLSASLSGRLQGRASLDLSGVTAPLASIGNLATRAAQTVQRALGNLRPSLDTGQVTGALTRLRSLADSAGQATRAALGRLRVSLDVQGFTASLRGVVEAARGAGQRIAASLAGAKVSVDLSPLSRLIAAGRQAAQAFRGVRFQFDVRSALQAAQSLAQGAQSAATAVRRSFAALRAQVDTSPATRALAALQGFAQTTAAQMRARLAGVSVTVDTTAAGRALAGLGQAAQGVAARVRSGLAGLRATLDAAPAVRTLSALGQAAVAAGIRIKSAVSGIVAKVDTRDLQRLPLIAISIGAAFAALHPHLDTAGLIEPLSRVQLLTASASTLVGAVWQRVRPRLEASGILEPLKRIPAAALNAARQAGAALAGLRPSVNVQSVVAAFGRIASVAVTAAAGVRTAFANLRPQIVTQPALAALGNLQARAADLAQRVARSLSGLRATIDTAALERLPGLAGRIQTAFSRVRLSIATDGLTGPMNRLADLAGDVGARTRAAFATIGTGFQSVGRTAAQVTGRVQQAFAALRPRIELSGITGALAGLPATAVATARRVTAAFSRLRANLNTTPFAQGLNRVNAAVAATAQRARTALGSLPVNVVTAGAEAALTGLAARARDVAGRVTAAFSNLRPQVDTSGLERVPTLTARIGQSLGALRERFQALRGGLTVPTAVDERGLTAGIQAATIKVANFHPTATARLLADAKPIDNAVGAAQQKLSAFEKQFQRTAQQLALLKAPDATSRLQIKFPTATPQQISQLAAYENEIEKISATAKRARPSITGLGDSINNLLSGGALAGIAAAVQQGFSRPILGALGSVLKLGTTMEGVTNQLKRSEGGIVGAGRAMESFRETSDRTGFALVTLTQSYANFRTAGAQPILATGLVKGLANAAAFANLTTEDVQGAQLQLRQIISSNKLQGDELKIIMERIPVFAEAVKNALGTIDTEKLAKSGEPVQAQLAKIAVELLKIKAPTDTTQIAINKLTNELQQLGLEVAKILLPIVRDIAKAALPILKSFTSAWGQLSEPVKKFSIIALGASAVLLPFALRIGALMLAIGPLTAAIKGLSAANVALAGTSTVASAGVAGIGAKALVARLAVGGFAAALALLTVGVVTNFGGMRDKINAVIDEMIERLKLFGANLGALGRFANNALNSGPSAALEQLNRDFATNASVMEDAVKRTKEMYATLARERTKAAKAPAVAGGNVDQLTATLQKQLAQFAKDQQQTAGAVSDAYKKAIEDVKQELAELRAPTLVAKIEAQFKYKINRGEAEALARLIQQRDREKAAVEEMQRALETLSSGLRDFAKDLLSSASQLPAGALRRETEARARALQARAGGIAAQGQLPLGTSAGPVPNLRPVVITETILKALPSANVLGLTPDAKQGLKSLNETLAGLGVSGGQITSGKRDRPGIRSFHNTGEAVDIVTPGNMAAIAQQLQGQGFRAQFERKGQRNANGSVASGDHIHVTLAAKAHEHLTKAMSGTTKGIQSALPIVRSFVTEETALADPAIRAREVFQSLQQRFFSARREFALLSATTAEGRINVDLLGREFAKSDPLLVHWAQSAATMEERLRRLQLGKQIEGIGRNARQEFLTASAATDAQRISLEQLGVSLQSLPQAWQAVIERSAEFSRQAKAISAVADAQREFLASVARTREAELAITDFRMAFEQLSPAVQDSLKQKVAWERAYARSQNVQDATSAIADMRLETAKASATNELQRRGLELLQQPLDDYAAGLRDLGKDLVLFASAQQNSQRISGEFNERLRQSAGKGIGGQILKDVFSLTDALKGTSAEGGRAGNSITRFINSLKVPDWRNSGAAVSLLNGQLLGIGENVRTALPNLSAVTTAANDLGNALAAGSESQLAAAIGRAQTVFKSFDATVVAANPHLEEFGRVIEQMRKVMEATGAARADAFFKGIAGISEGARRAAEELKNLQAQSAIEQRTAEVTAQAMGRLSIAFLKGGGDVEQFVQTALVSDKTLRALRHSLALSAVASEEFGKSFEEVMADAFEQLDLTTILDNFLPMLDGLANFKIKAEDLASGSKTTSGALNAQAEVTRRLKEALTEATVNLQSAAGGGDLYRFALERLNLTTTALTDAQKQLAVEFGEKAFRAEITGRVTAARQAMEAATGTASKQVLILRELGIEFGNLTAEQQKFATENINKILRFEAIAQFADGVKNVFQTAFSDLYQNGFRGFFNSVVSGFNQMLVKLAADFLASQVTNLLSNAFGLGKQGGGGGGGLGGAIGSLLGGLFGGTRDGGGPVSPGRAYLIGPQEVFVPRQSGTVLNPQQSAAAMSGSERPINVNITVHATDAGSFRRSQGQIAGEVARNLQIISRREGR